MVIKREPSQPQTPGQLIRAYRLERGITMEQMAECLYCSKTELSLIQYCGQFLKSVMPVGQGLRVGAGI